jgi:CYTH domain-containing protein
MEVERKFLVKELPDLDGTDSDEIEQGYLATGADGEVRVRRKGERLVLTAKRGSGLSREEGEVDLDRASFDELWPLTEGRRLHKRRHVIPHGDLKIELDVYEGDLDGLRVAEIEFGSEEEAKAFDSPDWLGEEVTGDERYLNETLAAEGLPEI